MGIEVEASDILILYWLRDTLVSRHEVLVQYFKLVSLILRTGGGGAEWQ